MWIIKVDPLTWINQKQIKNISESNSKKSKQGEHEMKFTGFYKKQSMYVSF